MSPSSLPGNPRVVRPWLAAALMMTVWLAATPARCDPGPGADRLAASIWSGPAWHWLQRAWAGLGSWGAGGAREWQGYRPATRLTVGGWQGAGSAAPDDGSAGGGSGSGGAGAGGSDPNG